MGMQHYLFTHKLLPQRLKEDPAPCIEDFEKEDGLDLLRRGWEVCGERAKENHSPTGLDRFTARINADCRAVVITMPQPQTFTEAYYAAIVFWPNRVNGPEPCYRYFTLELSQAEDRSNTTVLCVWQKGIHRNLGAGPPADPHAFLEAVMREVN